MVEAGVPFDLPNTTLSTYFLRAYSIFALYRDVGFFLISIPLCFFSLYYYGLVPCALFGTFVFLQNEAGGSSSSDMIVMFLVIDGKNLSSFLKLSMKFVFLIVSVISLMLCR